MMRCIAGSLLTLALVACGGVAQRAGGLGQLAFDIPDNEGNYVDGVSCDDERDRSGNYPYESAIVNAISVECIESGKIGKGQNQVRNYYLAPGSSCQDAVYP